MSTAPAHTPLTSKRLLGAWSSRHRTARSSQSCTTSCARMRNRCRTQPPKQRSLCQQPAGLQRFGSKAVCRRGLSAAAAAPAANLDVLELETPFIDADLRSVQADAGATFDEAGIATCYGNDEEAESALQRNVAIVDRSHWGRLRVTGRDRLSFLHGQSTAKFTDLRPGEQTETVFTTPQGRTLDLVSGLVSGSGVLLIVSPTQTVPLEKRLQKFILFGDEVEVTDVSCKTAMFSLVGPDAADLLEQLGVEPDELLVTGDQPRRHLLLNFGGKPVIVAAGSGLASPGFTVIADETVAGDLWAALSSKGAVPFGEQLWERQRVLQGRPAAGRELTDAANPLEAGLYHAISLSKGCYVGQETLAKVHNKNAVKQQLWGLRLSHKVDVGAAVLADGKQIGAVTSIAETPDGNLFGLAFLRCKVGGVQVRLEDMLVEVDGAPARVTELPFLHREFTSAEAAAQAAASTSPSSRAESLEGPSIISLAPGADTGKEERLAALQRRLAEWQAQQPSS